MDNKLKKLMLLMSVSFFLSQSAFAVDASYPEEEVANGATEKTTRGIDNNEDELGTIFNAQISDISKSHFTWGADVGTSIDVSGYDASTFDVDAMVGYKNSYFRILGIGAGFHRAIGSGDNYIPLYAVMRTSFSSKPKLFFFSLKAGYSFNTIGDAPTYGDVSASAGVGLNLACSDKFKTHIILGYEFRHFNKRHKSALQLEADNISLATLTFGINF